MLITLMVPTLGSIVTPGSQLSMGSSMGSSSNAPLPADGARSGEVDGAEDGAAATSY
jgi:hypothetical protein